jgi:hypothetical protein
MEKTERVRLLIKVLEPCLKKSRNKEWGTPRYITHWGSKTELGLGAVVYRIMYDEEIPASVLCSEDTK